MMDDARSLLLMLRADISSKTAVALSSLIFSTAAAEEAEATEAAEAAATAQFRHLPVLHLPRAIRS